ncbi:MAG: PspC domain-containing protein [Polaribacter sp.]|nr:PspC domain-containing protein [Polaribacter sp.]
MNKTININLGGLFFHIDEIAFQKLRRYLDAISRSLSDDPQGKNEIIKDIEARISELLSEKIKDTRQVVNEGDIDEIIKTMGQPEDYADAEEGYTHEEYQYKRKRASGKKLFRDGDDKFLGGVASGISHYFDVDTVWIRLAFILLAFSGFSIITYVILWIVIPEAETTAEKLQMEGEPVNIDNIEKKIREEFSHVSDNIKTSADKISGKIKDGASELTKKVNDGFKKKHGKKTSSGFQDFLDTLGTIILTCFKIIGKFIGVILMIVAALTLISLIIGAFSIGSLEIIGLDNDFVSYPPFFYDSMIPMWLLTICLFLVIGLPFLILFVLGLRILSSNVKQFSKATSLTLLGVWLVALLALIFTGIEFSTTKAYNGYAIEKNELTFTANDTLKIKMLKNDDLFYQSNYDQYNNHAIVYQDEVKKLYSSNIKVDVEKSETGSTYIQIKKRSEGRNRLKANKIAAEIAYNFNVLHDEILLDSYFLSNYKSMAKDEAVSIVLFVPEGVSVYFDHSSKRYLNQIDNTTNTYDRDMVEHYFLMTKNGLDSEKLRTLKDLETDD